MTTYISLGTDGIDDLDGGCGIDIVDMGGGADTGGGGGGINFIFGGGGADGIESTGCIDFVFGDSGDDTITTTAAMSFIRGGTGADTITGGGGIDFIRGDSGDDHISGGGSRDFLRGGDGADTIDGGEGDDYIVGGADDDTLTGGTGADIFVFQEGHGDDTITDFDTANDKISLRGFDETITWDQLSGKIATVADANNVVTGVKIDLGDWGGGTITLDGITSVSDLTAAMFRLDKLVGTDDVDDTIRGGTDDDTMTGGTGADTFVFYGGHGNDTITDFDTASDRIDLSCFGTAITWDQLSAKFTAVEDDPNTPEVESGTVIDLSDWGGGTITLDGVASTDLTAAMFDLPEGDPDGDTALYYLGNEEDNTQTGGARADTLMGGEGDDTLSGGAGADRLIGGEGDDTLDGGADDDLLMGGEGGDTLTGGAGEDWLIGGEGYDILTGGADADTFVFSEGHGFDTITDFDTANDVIDLTAFDKTITWAQVSEKITAITDVVGLLQIDLSDWGGGTVTLEGLNAVSDLTEDHFILDKLIGADDVDDRLSGGTDDDTMTGGTGADTFVFRGDHGDDTITDFANGEDAIDLAGFGGIAGFSDLTATQEGSDVKIDLSDYGGGTVTLTGFTLSDLDASDFVFYGSSSTGDSQDGM